MSHGILDGLLSRAHKLAGLAVDYVETKIDEVKMTTAEKTSALLANIIGAAIVSLVFLFSLLFFSIALAFVISRWIGSTYSGFFIVAGFYLLIGIIVWVGKNNFIRIPIMNKILQQLYKKDNLGSKSN